MKIINLSKVYHNKNNEVLALDNITLDFDNVGLTIIVGSSGSGKTTLLNIITQIDTKYDGDIINPLSASYLSQNIELFENLSVEDNINLISKDKKQTTAFLRKFNLINIKNKKIKKCSQGQKRRVQVLCAYLNNKQMLVFDEPTAALDYDNAVLIMELLKEIAKEKLVIVVTHDMALASSYADRIIEIDSGKIKRDINIKQTVPIVKQDYNKQECSIIDNFKFILKDIKSRPIKFILSLLLSCIGVLALYLMFNIFVSVNSDVDYLETIRTGESIVVTYNEPMVSKKELEDNYNLFKTGLRDSYYPRIYVDYDNIPYVRLVSTIDNIEDIVAVEVNTDHDLYYVDNSRMYQEVLGKDQQIYKCLPTLTNGDITSIGYPFKPLTSPFISNITLPSVNEYTQNDFIIMDEAHKEVATNSINLFHVVNDSWEIPLLYGEPMSDINDIIIDTNTAKLWQQLYDIKDMESLIGTKIELKVCTWASIGFLQEEVRAAVINENYDFFESYYYTIKGITNLTNEDMRIALVNSSIQDDQILNDLVINADGLDFKDVKFILKPGSDYEKVCNEINDNIGLNKTSFVQKSNVTDDNIILNRNNDLLIVYLCVTVLIIFGIYYINLLMNKKIILKEDRLLKDYAYSPIFIDISKILLIMLISLLVVLIVSEILIVKINELVILLGYNISINSNIYYLILATIIMTIAELLMTLSLKLFKR